MDLDNTDIKHRQILAKITQLEHDKLLLRDSSFEETFSDIRECFKIISELKKHSSGQNNKAAPGQPSLHR